MLKGIYLKFRYGKHVSNNDKVVLIELPQNKFNRYLYPLLYMLNKQGYKSVLKLDAIGIAHLVNDSYQKLILENGLLYLASGKTNIVKTIKLSPDYFNALKCENRHGIIPMSMHPLLYGEKYSFSESANKLNRVIFFAGNTNAEIYNEPQVFDGLISRRSVIDFVKSFDNTILPSNELDYKKNNFANDSTKFLIFERHIYNLSQKQLLVEMSKFSFFLALPGRSMPVCHNLIEAMYCGNIPILQDVYADMMPNKLKDNINCLIYSSLDDVSQLTERINALSSTAINNLRKNVSAYYNNYLSSTAVTQSIINSEIETFYLQAEGFSLGLYNPN